ncbi:MAG: response regulator [Anaerolineae bacterium]
MIDVIYIEDDDIEAELFTLGLSSRGVHVLHVPDTEPGSLNMLNQPEFRAAQAVFIDFWIGVTSGLDIARTLREQGDGRPFFLLTAGENPDPAELKLLNITYVQKPANYNKLVHMLTNGQ